jgi:ubiquinone/menaquinone biosynthesis C-methylase UbiE
MKLKSLTGIALAAAVGSNANSLETSSWVRAQLRQAELVVDIACRNGASSIAVAERAGPFGRVLGIDVSAPMLGRAAERLPPGAPVVGGSNEAI